MSKYDQINDFAAKDAINAPVVGTEFQLEFDAIQKAVNSKADSDNTILTGTPVTPTPLTPTLDGATPNQIINVEYVTNGAAPIDAQSLRSRNQVTAKTGNASANNINAAGYVFSGDNDSGLFNPEDGRVTVAINGTNRLSVTSEVRAIAPLVAQSGLVVSTGQVTLQGTGRVTGVDTVSASTDAANKSYVDSRFSVVADSVKNVNRVGSLVWALHTQDLNNITYNSTIAGSQLVPSGIDGNGNARAGDPRNLPGTWRCLGYAIRNSSTLVATLFVRIF